MFYMTSIFPSLRHESTELNESFSRSLLMETFARDARRGNRGKSKKKKQPSQNVFITSRINRPRSVNDPRRPDKSFSSRNRPVGSPHTSRRRIYQRPFSSASPVRPNTTCLATPNRRPRRYFTADLSYIGVYQRRGCCSNSSLSPRQINAYPVPERRIPVAMVGCK